MTARRPKLGYEQRVSHTLCAFCMLWLMSVQNRVVAEDLRVSDRSWNGLSELLAIASAEGSAEYAARVDVTQLTGNDAVLVVHPVSLLPGTELAKFMRRGGRVAVADDFGAGRRFFATFGMDVRDPRADQAQLLRGNANLPVAMPLIGHALADSVSALVTNHPQVLYHPTLTPVFGLSGEQAAVVLSGAVGSGRLVAISDASVLINNMLQFRGNRMFARNLVAFLRGSGREGGRAHAGRLLIADSQTRWPRTHQLLQHPIAQLTSALDRLAQLQPPRLAVVLFSIGLAGLLLSMLATSLPKRSAYARRAYLQTSECAAGMAGRVNQYASGERSLLAPLLALRRELEQRAHERLRPRGADVSTADGAPTSADPDRAARDGAPAALANGIEQFSNEVDRFQKQDLPVSARQFSELVATSRRILADFEDLPVPPPHHHERHE